jgi:hypothetical protein
LGHGFGQYPLHVEFEQFFAIIGGYQTRFHLAIKVKVLQGKYLYFLGPNPKNEEQRKKRCNGVVFFHVVKLIVKTTTEKS